MADLTTQYLGLTLKNPIIVGASKITSNIDTIKQCAEAGAGAIVCASLFEEQIQLERYKLELEGQATEDIDSEIGSMFPENLVHSGPQEHLMWVKKTKEAVDIPVIGSLNAVNKDTWVEYAQQMQDTGVDALELNFYYTPLDMEKTGAEVESEQIDTLKAVKAIAKVPVSVKLSYFYSNPLNVIKHMADIGVDGFVLFNRLFESDIDTDEECHTRPFNLSNKGDNKLPMRYMGLLHGRIGGSLCCNTGIFTGRDAIKALLTGADTVQIVSTLYNNKIDTIKTIIDDIDLWMEKKQYSKVVEYKGKLAQKNVTDKFVYKRAQYVDLILRSDELLGV